VVLVTAIGLLTAGVVDLPNFRVILAEPAG